MYLYVSASIQFSKKIPTAIPLFSGSRNSVVPAGRLDVETGSEKFKMAAAKLDVPAITDTGTDPVAIIDLATVSIRETLY